MAHRPYDDWTEKELSEWVGDRVFTNAKKLLARLAPAVVNADAGELKGSFDERNGRVDTMLWPGDSPARSRLTCTCPEFEEGPCRHAVALILAVRAPAKKELAGDARIQQIFEEIKAREFQRKHTADVIGFRLAFGAGEALVIEACRFAPGAPGGTRLSAANLQRVVPEDATAEARAVLEALAPYVRGREYVVPREAAAGLVAKLRAAVTFVHKPAEPLVWRDALHTASFVTADLHGGISVVGSVADEAGTRLPLTAKASLLALGESVWIFDGKQTLARLAAPEAGLWLQGVLPGPAYITPSDLERWVTELLPALRLCGAVKIGDRLTPTVVEATPKPVVLLQETGGALFVRPRMRYPPSHELLAPMQGKHWVDGGIWYVRDVEEESDRVKMFRSLLISDIKHEDGYWLTTDRALWFLDEALAQLTAAGWEVRGDETLAAFKLMPGALVPSVKVETGLDWFDVEFEFQFGEERFDGWKLLAEWDKGKRYVAGKNGFLKLPTELLKNLRERLSELPEGRRLKRTQATLIANLLGEMPAATLDAGWRETAKALASLDAPEPVPLPAGLQASLRPYQKDGLDWIAFLAKNRFGGLLADDMGLGKTLQAIAYLLHEGERGGRPLQALVVCPSSVVFNWERELGKFAPALTKLRWTGDGRAARAAELDTADVVITNYAILRRDVERLSLKRWRTLILDEAQAIKNAGSQTAEAARVIPADFRLALSGTPIENHLGELWSYFEFLMPGFFAGQKNFQERYVRHFDQPGVAERLRKRVTPFIRRRLKQMVAAELPPKTETVVECVFDEAQKNAYESVRAAYKLSLFEKIEKEGFAKSKIHVLEALLRLRQACCDPQLLPYEHLRGVTDSTKRDALFELMDDAVEENHKMIVFSQFTEMLNILETEIQARGYGYARLDGSTADREAPVTRFQTDPECKVILVSLRAGGTGLNLTAADYVVHYDPWWNPAVEDQATDRAYRIGQTRPVFVYKLVVKGSVEEKMIALQAAKRGLVDGLFGDGAMEAALTLDDLKDIFE
jgi:hypothetical protein